MPVVHGPQQPPAPVQGAGGPVPSVGVTPVGSGALQGAFPFYAVFIFILLILCNEDV